MRAALIVSTIIAVLLVAAWGLQRRLIYQPSGSVGSPVAAGLNGARDVELETSNRRSSPTKNYRPESS
jgi:hypothetical protein